MPAIDDYLNDITPAQKAEFERIRKLVHTAAPEVEETISYGIPTFKYKGKHLLYFGAFKNHMSIFPGSALAKELQGKLKGYKIAKGTIQFTESNPLPEPMIKQILASRLDAINTRN